MSSCKYTYVVRCIIKFLLERGCLSEILKKTLRRAEGGAKMFGVFRVKNHDFTPKNHIRGRASGAPPGSPPEINKPDIT